MTNTKGAVTGVNGNMVSVRVDGTVSMNEVAYIVVGGKRLKSEIIRVQGDTVQTQVFEMTKGIKVGDPVEFTGEMLAVELGPGLLGKIYDGLQNPLPEVAAQTGYFLEPGVYLEALPRNVKWSWTPAAKAGDKVERADLLGTVPEGAFTHRVMVPFGMYGSYTVKSIKPAGEYQVTDEVAVLEDESGVSTRVTMMFQWPVKRAIDCYAERLKPVEPMVTKTRIIDTFFPVAKGGTYCIPGPFGAGKTVLQQVTSRNADVDIVIIAACGERAGEVVETLKEFPELL
ncbi:MAG TPA: V-type ATP synthase subunit A, partial [Spirochaetales bacterium]|nr:V-type ATP synthase subunit A [Spirochaetales bacterium]